MSLVLLSGIRERDAFPPPANYIHLKKSLWKEGTLSTAEGSRPDVQGEDFIPLRIQGLVDGVGLQPVVPQLQNAERIALSWRRKHREPISEG